MGEAKRRKVAGTNRIEPAETVPDCFFWRDREQESRLGHVVAGKILTRIRRPGQPTRKQAEVVRRFLQQVAELPHVDRVFFNWDGSPFDTGDKLGDDAWLARHYGADNLIRFDVRLDPSELGRTAEGRDARVASALAEELLRQAEPEGDA